jgi:hypothetical protein
MGSMGVVINVIVSFHSIYILYIIYHIYIWYVYHTHTHIYRYISRFSTFFLSLVAMGSHSLLLRMALPCWFMTGRGWVDYRTWNLSGVNEGDIRSIDTPNDGKYSWWFQMVVSVSQCGDPKISPWRIIRPKRANARSAKLTCSCCWLVSSSARSGATWVLMKTIQFFNDEH